MQDPIYPTFTDDGKGPVVFDWPIATANSSDTFPNVNYALIQSQMAQFFPNTAPPGVFEGITDSNTYAIGVFYKVRVIFCYFNVTACAASGVSLWLCSNRPRWQCLCCTCRISVVPCCILPQKAGMQALLTKVFIPRAHCRYCSLIKAS